MKNFYSRGIARPPFISGVAVRPGFEGASVAALAAGGGGRLAYGDQQVYAANGYTAYASPWSTFTGGANEDLSRPEDYQDTIRVDPAQFPNNTRIETRWPDPGNGSITGYYFVAGADYDGGDASSWADWQVGNLTSFTETYSISIPTGDSADYLILNEFYLTTTPGSTPDNTKRYEIAHWYHQDAANLDYFNSGALIGEQTDDQARVWEVRNMGANPVGADYVVFLLKNRADLLAATIDNRAALLWLRDTGGLPINHLYVNSPAIGIETFRGVVVAELATYAISFAGSGSVIPAPAANLITNGDFSAGDAGWSGFWFSGKEPTGGKAVFTATPAFDGIQQSFVPTSGKYYELTYTISVTSGSMIPRFVGGSNPAWPTRSTSGTAITARIAATSSNTALQFLPNSDGFTGTIDDVILTGPYDTADVGGA